MRRLACIRGVLCGATLLVGCAHAPEPPEDAIAYGPLKDVILLPLTTRSLEGLLGHGLYDDGLTPDPSRCIVKGPPHVSETQQHVTVVREVSGDARVAGGYGSVGGEASHRTVTHVAYVVMITGYASTGQQARYLPQSDCCFNGVVQPKCEPGYVLRLVRGSGVIKYLQRADSRATLRAGEVFSTRLGQHYRVVDESAFEDAFFAFEPGDTQRLCDRLTDVESFAAARVAPAPNCSVMAYDVEGNGRHLARFLPDEVACRGVSQHFCDKGGTAVRCVAAFMGKPIALRGRPSLDAGGPAPPGGNAASAGDAGAQTSGP